MKNKFLKFLILTIFLSFCGNLYGQELNVKKYSLDDLYKLALINSEQIKIYKENLFITKKDRDRAFAVLIPRLTLFGGYSQTETSTTISVIDKESSESSFSWGVRFDQSFTLNGKELIALDANGDQIKKAESDLKRVKENYLFQVATLYYSVIRAGKILKIYDVNLDRLSKHKKSIETKLKLEEVPKTDLFRANAELSGAKADLVKGKNSLRYGRTALINLVGVNKNFELVEPISSENQIQLTVEDLKRDALIKRADIKSAQLDVSFAEKYIAYSKSDYWPTISLSGQYGNTSVSGTYTDPTSTPALSNTDVDTDVGVTTLGINLTFTLYDGGLRSATIKQFKARRNMADLALKAKRKAVSLEMEKAYLDLVTQESLVDSLKDKYTSAKENYNAISEHFKYGLVNSIDVMDANSFLVSAERQFTDAKFGLTLSLLNMEFTKGNFLNSIKN